MPPPRPNHPSDTRAAASQHVGRSRCWNQGGLLGTNTDRTRHKGTGSGVCCDRLARTQIVEAEAAATPHPHTLPTPPPAKLTSRPISGCVSRPSPTLAGGNRPSSPPAASACRSTGTRSGVPPLPRDSDRASARLAVPKTSEHAPGLRHQKRVVMVLEKTLESPLDKMHVPQVAENKYNKKGRSCKAKDMQQALRESLRNTQSGNKERLAGV
ncbi:PREDICTED: uncharacterized protein LOC105003374 [Bison bison bison]|uniref:Uncharacterized protein LOC105003374 n=1 Tax=Bison bison bison TaxID=43346 RepID=A0A6P3IWS0_BISBB|nr:PREDICTED: uncharacterized protein LOC105003374 [Bison bison bison]